MRREQNQSALGGKGNSRLVQQAMEARDRALANSSSFKVGAALQANNKKIYLGCNIETITSNLGICAERVALFKALSEGERQFRALAIVASSGQVCTPCGVCRQLLWEFAPGLKIIMMDNQGRILLREIRDLLPLPFDRSVLKKART